MANQVVEIDVSGVEAFIRRVGGFDTSGLMREIGHFIQFRILDRTGKGKDVEGNQFIPYTKSYKKVREEKGLQTAHVDLFFTGSMLSSMTFESGDRYARVFFMNTPRKQYRPKVSKKKKGTPKSSTLTNPEVAYYNNELREFFALSAKEVREITKIAEDYIDDLI